MRIGWPKLLGLTLLALLMGAGGAALIGHLAPTPIVDGGMHSFVHEHLQLSDDQKLRLNDLEEAFAMRRRSLDLSLRSANADLASAMQREHTDGPQVSAAVEVVHARMGDLQKVTIEHLFAMRTLLTPAQQTAFDAEVVRSLTADPS